MKPRRRNVVVFSSHIVDHLSLFAVRGPQSVLITQRPSYLQALQATAIS